MTTPVCWGGESVSAPLRITEGPYGFAWGPMEVVRATEHHGYVALDVKTDAGKRVTVYVSPTGRSIRVFGDGGEWKPAGGQP